MRLYITGELTESGEVDIKTKKMEKNEAPVLETGFLPTWDFTWRRERMSLDPRSMANATANDILMGQFPEQGSELVAASFLHFFFTNRSICQPFT